MDADSFIVHMKSKDIYADLTKNVMTRFIIKLGSLCAQCAQRKNKKVIELMKDRLGGTVMKEFVALRPEMYSYLTDNGYVDKKAKSTRKCMTKSKTKFKN